MEIPYYAAFRLAAFWSRTYRAKVSGTCGRRIALRFVLHYGKIMAR
jgi:hypothetical protein